MYGHARREVLLLLTMEGGERESEKKRPYPVSNHNVSNLNTTKTLKLKVGCIYLVS